MTVQASTGTIPQPAILRPHAEAQFGEELAALAAMDRHPRPQNWRLSPRAVITYLMGGKL